MVSMGMAVEVTINLTHLDLSSLSYLTPIVFFPIVGLRQDRTLRFIFIADRTDGATDDNGEVIQT